MVANCQLAFVQKGRAEQNTIISGAGDKKVKNAVIERNRWRFSFAETGEGS